jgi:quercetin dioxygenase-like cupin family protein
MKRFGSVRFLAVVAVLGSAAAFSVLHAQQTAPAIKRTVLLKKDATVDGREFVMVHVEIPPGATEGKHTHPAEVYAYVLEGTPTLEVEGQETRVLKPGDVFTIAPGQVHEGSNKTSSPVRLSAVFFAEKGKPLTTPVQK